MSYGPSTIYHGWYAAPHNTTSLRKLTIRPADCEHPGSWQGHSCIRGFDLNGSTVGIVNPFARLTLAEPEFGRSR